MKTKAEKKPKEEYKKVNAALCRECLYPVISLYRHHYVSCLCKDSPISVDGGFDYQKRVGDPMKFREIPLFIKLPESTKPVEQHPK